MLAYVGFIPQQEHLFWQELRIYFSFFIYDIGSGSFAFAETLASHSFGLTSDIAS
jgi:hypothetical protein